MMRILTAVALGLSAIHGKAQEIVKACAGFEVRAMNVALETGKDWPLSTGVEIDVVPQAGAMPESGRKTLAVTAFGPILGSATNSPEVKADLACALRGLTLGVTITHIGDGDAAKNALWRSKINLVVTIRRGQVLQTIWRLRRPDGTEVDHAPTPPYPDQQYPIVVVKRLSIQAN